MAISPREAAELSDNERENLANAEADIDATLRANYAPGNGTINIKTSYNDRLIQHLILRYQAVGWHCEAFPCKRPTGWELVFEAGVDGDRDALAGLGKRTEAR